MTGLLQVLTNKSCVPIHAGVTQNLNMATKKQVMETPSFPPKWLKCFDALAD